MSEAGRGRIQYTYPERAVPATCAKRHAVGADTKTANAILMAGEHTNALALESVPDVARPVVVTAEEDAARNGERDGGNTTQDVVMREGVKLAVSADVEEAA